MLAICRAVAESDGLLRNGGEAVYFSLPGWLFIHYRAAAARWLGLAPLLLGTLGLWGNRRGDLWTWPGVRKGMLLAGGAVAAGLAVASLSYELLRLLVPELFNGPHGTPYGVLAFGSSMANFDRFLTGLPAHEPANLVIAPETMVDPLWTVALDGVRRYPGRVKCATLAWRTLDAALNNSGTPATTE